VCRGVEYLPGWTLLDDLAGIHHGHPIGAAGDDVQVVADDEYGEAPLHDQLAEQVHDSRLGRRIEAGRWLISDEERRIAGEAQREHHPLSQAA
jgi:hypothetical protein